MFKCKIGEFVRVRNAMNFDLSGIVLGTMPPKLSIYSSSTTNYIESYCLQLSNSSKFLFGCEYYQITENELSNFGFCQNKFYWLNDKELK